MPKPTYKELEEKIKELEHQLGLFSNNQSNGVADKMSFKVPEHLEEVFRKAEGDVLKYFRELILNPNDGRIIVRDERYLLVRASALSSDFFSGLFSFYADKSKSEVFESAGSFLHDIGFMLGKEDASIFLENLNLTNVDQKLSSGPLHFAYTGWAKVEILPESVISEDENFFLKYNHINSFEAESWIKNGIKTDRAVCVMNAGYSAGWCSESIGRKLVASEITCRAKGDERCTFIMAPPDKMEKYLSEYYKSSDDAKKRTYTAFYEKDNLLKELERNQKILRETKEIAKVGSWTFIFENNVVKWSKELYKIFEVEDDEKENLYQAYQERFLSEEWTALQNLIQESIISKKTYELKHTVLLKNGRKKWVHCTGQPIVEDRKVIGFKGLVKDISEYVAKEKELENFFETSIDLLCIADFNGYFIKINSSWADLLGYENDELLQQPFINFVHPDDRLITEEATAELNQGKKVLTFTNRYRCKNGKYITLSWNAIPEADTGLIYAVARNVSEQMETSEQLKKSLHEKEILIKEIHHRVKNNMQVISSLLSLQASFIEDEKAKIYFDESRNRIKSMAALHEMLYSSKSLDKLNYKEYLEKLLSDLIFSYSKDLSVRYEVVSESIFLNLDTAVPLSLVINEIVSNSLKHAFDRGGEGLIYVNLTKNDTKIILEVGDNGKGFSLSEEEDDADSFGLLLISSLTEQLEGKLENVNKGEGTHYRIVFNEQF